MLDRNPQVALTKFYITLVYTRSDDTPHLERPVFVVVAMTHESSTGTETEPFKSPPIEIRFKSSLTYAEKLMLKRARRTELGTAVRGSYKHVCLFVYIM